MGRFRQIFTELSACGVLMAEYYSLCFYLFIYLFFFVEKFWIFIFLHQSILALIVLNKLKKMPHPLLIFSQSDYLIQVFDTNSQMTNTTDPDQLASEANWFGSALFAKAGYIRLQQD